MNENFWDDFAEEYDEIQAASFTTIEKDLTDFLLQAKILPQSSILDLAGGSGRYMAFFQSFTERYLLVDFSKKMIELAKKKANSKVAFLQMAQTEFFQQPQHFDLVFSAMNPALKATDLPTFNRLSKDWCCLLRVIEDSDSLFSPFEAKNPDLAINQSYKKKLDQLQISYQTKQFTYQHKEIYEKSFFHDYYQDELSSEDLAKRLNTVFGDQLTKENIHQITFEIIYYQVKGTS
ncbi:methyltransferase domain-containing protein [Enterococcus sp. AZ103]|uniref:methyltransferase domain-containing protein n=1 Tax=Enterococcus sp. AZ103 TaxID=2774628 RepID=UPI003F1F2E14